MTDSRHGRPSLRSSFVAFAIFLGAFYWLVVATYPSFFIFNPANDAWGVKAGHTLALIGRLDHDCNRPGRRLDTSCHGKI